MSSGDVEFVMDSGGYSDLMSGSEAASLVNRHAAEVTSKANARAVTKGAVYSTATAITYGDRKVALSGTGNYKARIDQEYHKTLESCI